MTDIEETPVATPVDASETAAAVVVAPIAESIVEPEPDVAAEVPAVVDPEPTPVEEAAADVADDATTFPALLIWKNRDGQWQVDARHASGQETSSSWAQLQHAFHNAEAWVRAHI